MIEVFRNDLPDGFVLSGDLAIDTEAIGLNIKRDRLCLLQFSNGDGRAYMVHFVDNDYSAPNLKKLLTSDVTKIFHFARFDVAIIKAYLGIEITEIFCTKIASKIARTYTSLHGLKELCRELIGVSLAKQCGQSYWGGMELSHEQREYAAQDVLHLHKLRSALLTILDQQGRTHLASAAFKCLPAITSLDLGGWQEDIFAHH